jgi:spermidine synthase/Tfp pilus assembly protein PilF/MFS family permease
MNDSREAAALAAVAIADTEPAARGRSRALAGANATVFVSSGALMVVELVAGRLISRYLGQSLYTWTAVIGIMLAGLSLGNYLGGRLADRRRGRALTGVQFLLAAFGCAAALGLNATAGEWHLLWGLPWPLRIVIHVSLAFLAPSVLLGAISPVVARRALDSRLPEGRVFGNLFAWSIAGSIVGTFATGFYLLLHFGATAVVWIGAAVLAAAGAAHLLPSRRREAPLPPAMIACEETPEPAARPTARAWLMPVAAVFIANGAVMAAEMVAGRMLARHFGQSLYTWTSVIGVVLAGMSLGSYAGGLLADRRPNARLLAALFALAALSVASIMPLREVLAGIFVLQGFSWPAQILIHTTALFFLPSALLGAIAPVATRRAVRDNPAAAGRLVGIVYAAIAAGSIAGTFLAGFYLIAAFGTKAVLWGVAGTLIATGLAVGRGGAVATAAFAAYAALLGATLLPNPTARTFVERLGFREATPPGAVYTDESQYAYIRVLAPPNNPNVRQLYLDRLLHSEIDLANPLRLCYDYEMVYAGVLDKHFGPERPLRALVIGGGGYSFPRYLEASRPGSAIEVAEIDPAVTEAAHAACGLPRDTRIKTWNMDARNRIADLIEARRNRAAAPAFDCIFGDSVNDLAVPYHLTTLEFTRHVEELLAPDGIYLLNIIELIESGRFLGALVETCRRVFPHVYVLDTGRPANVRDTFILVCAKRPLDLADVPARIRRIHDYTGGLLAPARIEELRIRTGRRVLTDDHAPVENLLAPVVNTWRMDPGEYHLDRARQLLAADRLQAATEHARRALATRPDWIDARRVLASGLLRQGNLDGAAEQLRRAGESPEAGPEVFIELGEVLERSGSPVEALAAFQRAVALGPRSSEAHERLGRVQLERRDLSAAVATLRRAVELDPSSTAARYNLGLAYAYGNDLLAAIEQWREAIRLDPQRADAHHNLITALRLTGRHDEARAAQGAAEAAGVTLDPQLRHDVDGEPDTESATPTP